MRRTHGFLRQRALLAGTVLTPLLVVPTVSHADDGKADSSLKRLDAVVVVATKSEQSSFDLPAQVSVINADDPSLSGATTLDELFLNTPSVQITGTARRSGQVPNIRGFDADSILVQFDGVRQNFQSAHDGRFFIDPSLIKQVDVVRGGASSLYGTGAVGGVIAFETLEAGDLLAPGETFGVDITAGYQSVNEDLTETAKVFGRTGNVDVLLGITRSDSNDIELSDGNDLSADDGLFSGVANINWFIDNQQTLTLGVIGYSLDAIEPNNPQIPDFEGDSTVDRNTDSITTRLQYKYENPDHALFNNFDAQVYYTRSEVEETVLAPTLLSAPGDEISRDLDTYGLFVSNQTIIPAGIAGNHTFTYGVEYFRDEQDGEDTGEADGLAGGIPDGETDTFGVFLQDEIAFDNLGALPGTLLFIPGVRFDAYQSEDDLGNVQSENEFSPRFGASYKPINWLLLFASYSESFRAPNLTELFSTGAHFSIPGPPGVGGVNAFIPNPELEPETADTIELGFGLDFKQILREDDGLEFKASYYDTDGENFIDLEVTGVIPGPFCCGTSQSINVTNADIEGYEIELAYESGAWFAQLAVTEVEATNADTGEPLFSDVPVSVTALLERRFQRAGLAVGWRGRFVREQNDVLPADAGDPDPTRSGFGLNDIYARYSPPALDQLTLDAGIDNLFDQEFQTVFAGAAGPGRNFRVQATWAF